MRKTENFFKRITAIGLSALAFVGALFCLSPLFKKGTQLQAEPVEASAAESFTRQSRLDNNFEFEQGAAVYKATEGPYEPLHALKFTVFLKNTKLERFMDEDKDFVVQTFTLYRDYDKGVEPIYRVVAVSQSVGNNGSVTVWGHKRVNYDESVDTTQYLQPSGIYFSPEQFVGDNVYTRKDFEQGKEAAIEGALAGQVLLGKSEDKAQDYEWDATIVRGSKNVANQDFLYGEKNGYPAIAFTLGVDSTQHSYFVGYDYTYHEYEGTKSKGWWLWKETYDVWSEPYKGTIHSQSRSIVGVLKNMEAAGVLETQFPDAEIRAHAEDILRDDLEQEVKLRYLEPVKNTPFARMVEKRITVPVFSGNKLYKGDVTAVLSEANSCLGSYVSDFVYDEETQTYQAKYLTAVWLTAATADGKTKNYYLDINVSYEDYYKGLVEQGVLDQGGYESIFNSMKVRFPAVAALDADELHGYFGYVVMPETETFNAIWKDVFNRPDAFKGTVDEFSFESRFTYSAYMTLMKDYGYTWFQRVWQTAIDAAGTLTGDTAWEAKHYIFYADADVQDVVISQNGTTDIEHIEDNIMENDTAQAVDKVVTGVKDTINDTKSWFEEMQDELRTIYLVLLGCTLAAGLTVGIVFVVKKLRLNEPAKKPRKKKSGGKKQKK